MTNSDPAAIRAELLTHHGFAPYGDVLDAPTVVGREHFATNLVNLRPDARLDLSLVRAPAIDQTAGISELEHHPYSAQAFVPIDVDSYVILVALNGNSNEPCLPSLKAFIASRHQGICYRPGIWHLGMTTIGNYGAFALLVYADGTADDCVFRRIPAIRIQIPAPDASQ